MGCNTWCSVKDHLFPSQYAQWESCIQDLRVHWGKKDRPIISENDLSLQHDHFAFLVQALKDMHFLTKDQDADVLTVQCALKTLQAITGLPITGLLDPVTVDVLNGKNQILIEKIQKTQKEWQKIGPLPERYILCNIPSFTLDVFDNGVSVLHSRVMVGKVDSRTPLFSGFVYTLVFNPTWILPRSQYKTYMPCVGKDGFYLENHRLLQKPGPKNHLGQVKFLTRRADSIILHSTHEPELFDHVQRAYSLGCVRIQDFQGLAEKILALQGIPTPIPHILEKKIQKTVNLKKPFPVYTVYHRLWINDGVIQYFSDIYDHDAVEKKQASLDKAARSCGTFSKNQNKKSKKQIH